MQRYHPKGKFGWNLGLSVIAHEITTPAIPRADLAQAWQHNMQNLEWTLQCQKAHYDASQRDPWFGVGDSNGLWFGFKARKSSQIATTL